MAMKQWFMGLKLCWIYIQNAWYYRWMFEMRLIQYFKHPFFKSCSLLLTPWIIFSHLFVDFMHAHLHYISSRLLGTRISLSFHLSLVHDMGIFWEECCLYQLIFAFSLLLQQPTLLVFFLCWQMICTQLVLLRMCYLFFYDYKKSLAHQDFQCSQQNVSSNFHRG